MSKTYNVFEIADYFLWKAQESQQELLSNLKLQKLIYYAQGLYFTINDKPLFDEKIEAWTYGPVVADLYHRYKEFEANGIPADEKFDPESIEEDVRDFLDEVFDVFGQFSAIRLMEIAHSDECWQDAGIRNEISLKSMKKCFKKYLKDD